MPQGRRGRQKKEGNVLGKFEDTGGNSEKRKGEL